MTLDTVSLKIHLNSREKDSYVHEYLEIKNLALNLMRWHFVHQDVPKGEQQQQHGPPHKMPLLPRLPISVLWTRTQIAGTATQTRAAREEQPGATCRVSSVTTERVTRWKVPCTCNLFQHYTVHSISSPAHNFTANCLKTVKPALMNPSVHFKGILCVHPLIIGCLDFLPIYLFSTFICFIIVSLYFEAYLRVEWGSCSFENKMFIESVLRSPFFHASLLLTCYTLF